MEDLRAASVQTTAPGGVFPRPSREIRQHEANLERQLREILEREKNFKSRLREMRQREESLQSQLRETQQREENTRRQLRKMQQNSQKQLREIQQREENLQRQLREMQQILQSQHTEMQQRFENSQQRVSTLERQLRDKDREVNELVLSLSLAQQTVRKQQQQKSYDCVISRDEIQLTNKCLGRGGWGSVYEGVYCGCPVAVKQLHDLILSPHNISLFEREMNIASQCRHPHILQFIGATNDEGNPLFVTELMEKSLRALLEQRQLSEIEIRAFSLDVARALNYLHQKKPQPIIHRDLSSVNVLLWRQGDQWRAKVSDYGTANFMQQTMTVAPGSIIYCAPEALTSKQTVKVSFLEFRAFLIQHCFINTFYV